MDQDDNETASYDAEGVAQLETIWGEGFMSPGGPAEVGRIVAGVPIAGCDVLDIGCGTGGAPLASALRRGARVLRPGGRLCIGDWFRGEGAELDGEVDAFIATRARSSSCSRSTKTANWWHRSGEQAGPVSSIPLKTLKE
jgi:SAM-dependent methyltransferase